MELGADLIEELYATAEDQRRWTPVLDDLCARLDASSAAVQVMARTPERVGVIWQIRDTRSTENSNLHDRFLNNPDNPRLHRRVLAEWSAGTPSGGGLLGSDRRLFRSAPSLLSELQQRLAKVGLGHAFWINFPIAGDRQFSLILHRAAGRDEDLTGPEEAMLRQLLPHVRRSVNLRASQEAVWSRTRALECTLNQLDVPLLLCDANLRVGWSNQSADEIVADNGLLRIIAGRLLARGPDDNAILARLVRTVAYREIESDVGVLGADEDRPLQVRAAACPGSDFPAECGSVALFLWRPDLGSRIDPADLAILYQMTPAEARLAACLAGGDSLASYSEHRGIAIGTARNQLKQVLAKTSTRSQSELVRTLCSSAVARRLRTH